MEKVKVLFPRLEKPVEPSSDGCWIRLMH